MNFPINLSPLLVSAISGLLYFKYPLIVLGTLFEGPILMITCGFLLHYNVFNLILVFIALVTGDMLGDIVWYYIGQKFADKFLINYGKYFGVSYESFAEAKTLFYKYHVNILIISKLTLGFGMSIVTLMVAGATRVSFKKYFTLNLFGELVLTAMLMYIGYFFGKIYVYIAEGFKLAFIIGLIFIVCISIFALTRFVKSRLLRS